MKAKTTVPILSLLFLGITFSSCIKQVNVEIQPAGYQHSFNDDFNYDAHNWSFYDPAHGAKVYLSNGVLNYAYHPIDNGTNTVAVSTGFDTYHDWDIQTRISSDNAMGLVFGVSPSDYGYSVFIDDRGYFAVFDEGTAKISSQAILNWQSSGAIHHGSNDLEVEQYGNSWIGYINGSKVFEIPAHTLYGDQVGYMVLANTAGQADYLTVKW